MGFPLLQQTHRQGQTWISAKEAGVVAPRQLSWQWCRHLPLLLAQRGHVSQALPAPGPASHAARSTWPKPASSHLEGASPSSHLETWAQQALHVGPAVVVSQCPALTAQLGLKDRAGVTRADPSVQTPLTGSGSLRGGLRVKLAGAPRAEPMCSPAPADEAGGRSSCRAPGHIWQQRGLEERSSLLAPPPGTSR